MINSSRLERQLRPQYRSKTEKRRNIVNIVGNKAVNFWWKLVHLLLL